MSSTYTSAAGHAVVGGSDVAIKYEFDGASIAAATAGTDVYVYIPVPSPASLSQKLANVAIEADGVSGSAYATEVWVYFGKTPVLDAGLSKVSGDIDADASSSEQQEDAKPYGINVTLKLHFADTKSLFKIYSATLTFQ
ncbi:hypothetical protein HJFPF1_11084 [Paramyrothecium foliicola]|nr:hypothetical protein HJFPF1_11084 [Paramyrothecium foliicola]